ncbi:hypothetical protein [Oculatella sp. LEGE 06141]|nr:hypothetical protein [Oculatella sp. LEGE 06141]
MRKLFCKTIICISKPLDLIGQDDTIEQQGAIAGTHQSNALLLSP